MGLEIIEDSITKKLQDLSPETINNNQYTSLNIFEYSFIFQMLSLNGISENTNIGEDNSLKLLLINTENNKDNDSIKLKMLRKLKKTTLDNYIDQIQDDYMKFRIVNYLLLNNLSDTPSSLFAKYLPNLLSSHLFYPTIKTVSENYWSNDLAKIFLDQFLNFSWHPISAQMFEDYTSIFLELLTPEQLRDSEKNRKKPVNPNIQRIYNIWLEHSNIQSNKT